MTVHLEELRGATVEDGVARLVRPRPAAKLRRSLEGGAKRGEVRATNTDEVVICNTMQNVWAACSPDSLAQIGEPGESNRPLINRDV
eukprot:6482088-Amphidinium_carterae.3